MHLSVSLSAHNSANLLVSSRAKNHVLPRDSHISALLVQWQKYSSLDICTGNVPYGVEAVATPTIEGALDIRRLVGAIPVHVYVNLNAGKATDSLCFGTGPPLVCGTAGITIETARTCIGTAIGVDNRRLWRRASIHHDVVDQKRAARINDRACSEVEVNAKQPLVRIDVINRE